MGVRMGGWVGIGRYIYIYIYICNYWQVGMGRGEGR